MWGNNIRGALQKYYISYSVQLSMVDSLLSHLCLVKILGMSYFLDGDTGDLLRYLDESGCLCGEYDLTKEGAGDCDL